MKRSIGLLVGIPLAALALGATACGSSDDSKASGTTVTTAATTNDTTGTSPDAYWVTVQKELDDIGCWAGSADGVDGALTQAAIRAFQSAEGLTVDGELGPKTQAALTKAAASGTEVCTSASTTSTTAISTTTSGGGSGACAEVTELMVADALPGITDLKWTCVVDAHGFPWVGGYGTDQGAADVNFILQTGADVSFRQYDMANCTNPPVPQPLLTYCESN